jgi:predicted transcriptional regulator
MSDVIRSILTPLIPQLRIVQIALSSLDANDTGLDDEAARQLGGALNGIQAYLDSFPAAEQVAKGFEQIKEFCDNALDAVKTVIESIVPKEVKVKQLEDILATLNDSHKVYQAKNGKDGQYLAETKAKVKQAIADVQKEK